MPGIVVSLSEALGVRGAPLAETEVWAILNQSAVSFIEVTRDGNKAEGRSNFVVTPESLCFRSDGVVEISPSNSSQNRDRCVPPELQNASIKTLQAAEKCYVYSLGRTLIKALESGDRNQAPAVSRNLEDVLSSMCDVDPEARIKIKQVLQACSLYAERHIEARNSTVYTRKIYSSIMGSDSSEEEHTSGSHSSRHDGLPTSSRGQRSRGRQKYTKRRERQRSRSSLSRSRSPSRSRSRSRSRHRERRYDDEDFHQTQKENYTQPSYHPSFTQPPSYHEHLTMTPGRSYHLSDITFTSALNGGQVQKNRNRSRPLSGTGAYMNETAHQKYLRLKERQRKLKILRVGLMGEGYEDHDPMALTPDLPWSDTRSVLSGMSFTQGSYTPGLHMKHGSEIALKLGRESDRDSIISSEMSLYQDQQLRSKEFMSYPEKLTSQHYDHQRWSQEIEMEQKLEQLKDKFHRTAEENKGSKMQVYSKNSAGKLAHVNHDSHKHRDYYGPEFVHKSSKPLVRISVPLQGESLKSPSHVRRVVVVLLSGQKLEAMVDPSITAQQMFESIITHIELPEFFFFGLSYINEGEHFFMEPDVKLHKVAPDGWKDSWKENMPAITLTIYVRMKFYPSSVTLLRHQISKHLLYLQLRHDILEERTLCTEDQCMELSALALQAEYGDYDSESMGKNYFLQEHYFPHRIVKRVGNAYIKDHAAEEHKKLAGLTDRQAEIEFIKKAQKLQEYGIHFYKLQKNKSNTSGVMWAGINVHSLLLAENEPQSRVLVQQFPWQSIKKISFNKRRFSIQSKADFGEGKPPKLNYYTNSYRKGRYLLQFSTAQHRFELSMRSRESNIDPQELTLDSVAELMCDESMGDDEQSSSESHGASVTEPKNGLHSPTTDNRPLPYTLPPPYKADASVSMLDLRQKYKISSDKKRERYTVSTGDIFQESQREEAGPAYVLETADQSSHLDGDLPPNETINTTLHNRFNKELLSPERSERQVSEIILKKDQNVGFGITIVGGESANKLDLGIFVKMVTPGGPADRDGQIKPGDRLIAINGQSLEGVDHHTAVQMIRYSGDTVHLLVSQVRVPKSVKRRDDHDDAIAKLRASNASPSDVKIYRQISEDNHENQDDSYHLNVDNIPQDHVRDDPSVADVSTMSQIESIESEVIPVTDLPTDTQPFPAVRDPDDTENDVESEVDSDLEEGIQAVKAGHGLDQGGLREIIHSAEDKEWQKIDAVPSPKAPEILPGEVFEVTLDKTGGQFGLNVTGGKNTSVKFGGIYVKSLNPQSPAIQHTGQTGIQPGDRILAVGEIPMKNVTHKQAVEIIQNAPDICTFTVERGACSISSRSSIRSSNSSTGSADSRQPVGQPGQISVEIRTPPMMQMFYQGEMQQRNLDTTVQEKSETESKSKSSSSKGGSTAVHVEEHSDNDFTNSEPTAHTSSADSVDKSDLSEIKGNENNDQQVITEDSLEESLVPASLESTGLLSSGEVDQREEPGGLHREASELTENSDESLHSTDGNIYYPFVDKDNTFSVDLKKGPSGLGFSVYGGIDVDTEDKSQGIVRIKKVFPLGPARSSQQIQRDDVLLEVNGVPVKGCTHAEVVSLLHSVVTNAKLLMCRPTCAQLPPLPRSSSEEWMERRAAARQQDTGTPSETESEDEPILYRDTMSDRGVITPPSGFASPGMEQDSQQMFVPPPTSNPPPLPSTPPPSLSLQNSPLPLQGNFGIKHWGDFENLRTAISPRSMYSDEFNSTFNSTQESLEEVYYEEEGHPTDPAQVKKRSRSSSSQSDASESSTDSVVRSPLKGTYNTGEGLTASESGLDALLSRNNKHLGTGTNSLQSSEFPTDEDNESLGETQQYTGSPTAPRGSPTVPSSTPRDSPQQNIAVNPDFLNQTETGDEVGSESEEDSDQDELAPGEIKVVLTKDEKTGLGFSVYGGVSKGGCFVREIVSDPALSDGRLRAGDRLLEVNGIDLTKLNHTEAVGHLRNASGNVQILVHRPAQQSDPIRGMSDLLLRKKIQPIRTQDSLESEEEIEDGGETMNSGYEPDSMASTADLTNVTQPDMIHLELDRSRPGGLGFSLVTAEKDHQTGVFVKSIQPNSQADRDGRLQVMDRIVQINGESAVGLDCTKVALLIKASPNKVTLTVSRFSSRHLETMTPPILINDSDNEDEEDCDFVDEERDNADHLTASMKEDVYDSEDDDMDALVNEAEKLLLSSGSLDLSGRALNEGNFKTPGLSYKRWQTEERTISDENTDLSEFETQGTEELQEGFRAVKEEKNGSTFTIDTIQRKLDVEVPDDITAEWLNSLPLVVMSEDVKDRVPALISKLQRNLDQKNHQEEYKELRQVKSTDECTDAKLPENKPLNKFRNILPYDYNRVELSGNHDYINASHILMNVGEVEAHYIAAQGPLPETSQDFWQMIWEQNVSVIAMLTLDVENGKVKCHQYWPDSVETPLSVCKGLYKLSLLRVQYLEHFDIREIMIENMAEGKGRLVYHFMFTNWPDQAVPNTKPLLQYLQLIHAHHTTGPILVHCSAGIGRTGVLITIDLALAQIEKKGRCDIFEIVTELRKQRYGMIQVKDQYTLAYLACLDALKSLSP